MRKSNEDFRLLARASQEEQRRVTLGRRRRRRRRRRRKTTADFDFVQMSSILPVI